MQAKKEVYLYYMHKVNKMITRQSENMPQRAAPEHRRPRRQFLADLGHLTVRHFFGQALQPLFLRNIVDDNAVAVCPDTSIN